jgi:ribosomal protein L18E
MPVGPFRTYSQPVNVRDLESRFSAGDEVTPETLKEKGLIRKVSVDVKILGVGELTKALSVTAHGFSASAKEKIEAAGGSVVALREPKVKKARKSRRPAAAAEEPMEDTPADEAPEAGPAADEAPVEDEG